MIKKTALLGAIFIFLTTQTTLANMETDFAAAPAEPNSIKPGIFIYEVKPGESWEDAILVKNTSAEDYELNIYGVDSAFSAQGSKAFKKGWNEMSEVGSWIQLEKKAWILKSNEVQKVPFRINIPENTPEGDYLGGIALEKFYAGEAGNINTALRIIKDVQIKVTNSPQEVPKLYSGTIIPKPFFWITISIFICCMIYVIISQKKKHKHEKKRH